MMDAIVKAEMVDMDGIIIIIIIMSGIMGLDVMIEVVMGIQSERVRAVQEVRAVGRGRDQDRAAVRICIRRRYPSRYCRDRRGRRWRRKGMDRRRRARV